jgi:hypothetical protein
MLYLIQLVTEIYGIDVVDFEIREHDYLQRDIVESVDGIEEGDARNTPL